MRYYFFLLCLFLWTSCQSDQPSDQANLSTNAIEEPIAIPDSLHRIKLTFVGDIMGHTDQIRSAAGKPENFKSEDVKVFDYEPCFRYVAPILKQADLAIGNLELTLSNKGRYTGYPMFRSPDQLAYDLKNAGFDLLTTCNNHSNDGRVYGVDHTIEVLESLKIAHTGTFRDSAEKAATYPLIIEKEVNGTVFKLAFLSYTYGTNGVATRLPNIVNIIDDSTILADIALAKAKQPDIIIAMMHWGSEYKLNERPEQQKLTRLLWDNGVDVVIGGHPHVIEPIKLDTLYQATDSSFVKERLVTYSLGNFISNQNKKNTDIGLIFELELVKNDKTNQTTIGKHNYIFGWRYRHQYIKNSAFGTTYTIVPVSAFESNLNPLPLSPKDSAEMMTVTNRMRTHLGKWQSSERKVSRQELEPILPLVKEKAPTNTAQK